MKELFKMPLQDYNESTELLGTYYNLILAEGLGGIIRPQFINELAAKICSGVGFPQYSEQVAKVFLKKGLFMLMQFGREISEEYQSILADNSELDIFNDESFVEAVEQNTLDIRELVLSLAVDSQL